MRLEKRRKKHPYLPKALWFDFFLDQKSDFFQSQTNKISKNRRILK
jgi:hypothetical protein